MKKSVSYNVWWFSSLRQQRWGKFCFPERKVPVKLGNYIIIAWLPDNWQTPWQLTRYWTMAIYGATNSFNNTVSTAFYPHSCRCAARCLWHFSVISRAAERGPARREGESYKGLNVKGSSHKKNQQNSLGLIPSPVLFCFFAHRGPHTYLFPQGLWNLSTPW